MKSRFRPLLLVLLFTVLTAVVGMRFAGADENPPADKPAPVSAALQLASIERWDTERVEFSDTENTTEPELALKPEPDWAQQAEYIAKTIYGEALVCSTTERAAVAWCILNRVDSDDSYYPEDIISVILQPGQFHGYDAEHPVLPELQELALDVIDRWQREKDGETDTGRVLSQDYLFFSGDGRHNYFRTDWRGGTSWDWSLPSPYEEENA